MKNFTTVSQQMVTDINDVADDIFVFQQDGSLARHAYNSVKLLVRELSSSLV